MSKVLFSDFDEFPPGRLGYARASTVGQDLRRQVERVGRDGQCRRVYHEVVSGAARERPALEALRRHLRPGDVVVVESFDRLGRRAGELLELCEELLAGGVHVEALREGISTEGHVGRIVLPFVAALAEAERQMIRERTRIGVEEARRKGKSIGRPRVVSAEKARAAAAMRADGHSYAKIAAALHVSPSSVKRMLRWLDSRPAARQLAMAE